MAPLVGSTMPHRELRAPAGGPPAAAMSPQAAARRGAAHERLLAWYAAHGRDLPWRHTRDPYAILVSEVMLQQTQVERVLPKYREFLARFPTLAALAAAPTSEVIRAWAPLGYNVRAVRLQQIARQAVTECGGALPETVDGLLALKGIGRYTAGAVSCFAFGAPVATVDTNIRRVLWRVFRGVEPAAWPQGQAAARDALALAQWALPAASAYDWQQALMDLGATVCVSRRPACERCPLATCCAALAEVGNVSLFPSGDALAAVRAARAQAALGAQRVAESGVPYAVATAGPAATPRAVTRRPAEPFTSSSRYFRGRVLAALRELPPGGALPLAALGPRVKPDWKTSDAPWLHDLVNRLARDGLVQVREDAGEAVTDGALLVALPS
jgi:A/G-specific adenine glycosylase